MADSPLVEYEKYSPNITSPRNHEIDTISIHTMAGDLSIETCGNLFANPAYECSSQYGIGSDGRIAQYVSEEDRSWCTSSRSNDHRAITIEVAACETDSYACTEEAMESLINLLVDICQRNNIPKLLWEADPDLIGDVERQNMTVHRWFAAKSCLPVWTELLTEEGWKPLSEIPLGMNVASYTTDHHAQTRIFFSPVLDKIEPHEATVYTGMGISATKDHRILTVTKNYTTLTIPFEECFDREDIMQVFFEDYPDIVETIKNGNGRRLEGICTYSCKDVVASEEKEMVSCVTVKSGYILIRQHGNVRVVGNCPGEYLFGKHSYIADEVNKRLGNPSSHPTTKSTFGPDQFWEHFTQIGLNPIALAGLMGNIFAESGLIPINLQNSYEDSLDMSDSEYTQAVDDGSYDNFIHDSAGYGLAQWTYWSRKEGLLTFAKERGVSIGDAYMQMDYLWKELQENLDIATLNASTSVREASDYILHEFERPADQSEAVEVRRAGYGMEFYQRYCKEPSPPKEFEAFNVRVVATLLNVRSGPGTNFGIKCSIMDQGLYGICEVSDGEGASQWGRMCNGWGWISLDYCERE